MASLQAMLLAKSKFKKPKIQVKPWTSDLPKPTLDPYFYNEEDIEGLARYIDWYVVVI